MYSRKKFVLLGLVIALVATPGVMQAAMIPFFIPGTSTSTFGMGSNEQRVTLFKTLSPVTLTQLGAEIDPVSSSAFFSWQILNSDATATLGSEVFDSGSFSLSDVGMATYNTSVNVSLNTNSYYLLRLTPALGGTRMQRYNEVNQGIPFTTTDSNFSVVNGYHSFSSGDPQGNTILPSFSVSTTVSENPPLIPEPTTGVLALMGLLILSCHGWRRRRR